MSLVAFGRANLSPAEAGSCPKELDVNIVQYLSG
jgi:hypothetical protein